MGKKGASKTWKERVIQDLADRGYTVEEFRDDGVLCKNRSYKYVLIGYAESKESSNVNMG